MNIYDIAEQTGLSIATVSRVINGKENVSEKSRNKVQKVMKESNYIPNRVAKHLASKKTNIIGIVMPRIDPYLSTRIDGINTVCKQQGYSLMITANTDEKSNPEDELINFNLLLENRVDGIIYFPTLITKKHMSLLQRFEKAIPMVITDTKIEGLISPTIIQDRRKSTQEVVEYLVEGGHKRIAFINGDFKEHINNERFEAYKQTLLHKGLSFDASIVRSGENTLSSGYQLMKNIIESGFMGISAVIAATDTMAMGAMKALAESGYKVPDHVSVIGYGGLEMGQFFLPKLTTVKVNQQKMGENAANMLIELIEKKEVENPIRKMEYEILYGDSTRVRKY